MMHDYEDILLRPESSIREAMRVLEKGATRIVLVCNENKQLLGTVTDGDIRRGLLKNAEMSSPVKLIMNNKSTYVHKSSSKEHRLELMKSKDLLALPVIDNSNKIVGVETLSRLLRPEKRDNPIFIMAGGFGTRLQPLTDYCPKPMLRVGDKPMLEHLINQFLSYGFHNFYVSTHYLPEIIQDYFGDGSRWGASIQYVYEESPLGTGGALGLLPKDLPDLPLIMMNGDVLTKLNYIQLLENHVENANDATMCVREDEHRIPFGVIETEGEIIVGMVEKPVYRYRINTGIYVLNPSIVSSVKCGQRIDVPTLLESHRQRGKKVGAYTSYDYWLDIGQMKDYHKAQHDYELLFKGIDGLANE